MKMRQCCEKTLNRLLSKHKNINLFWCKTCNRYYFKQKEGEKSGDEPVKKK